MLKVLAIIVLFFFLFRTIGVFLRFLMGGSVTNRGNDHQYRRKQRDGDLNVDYKPKGKKDRGEFKGGEYVDYEDVSE